ncbi:MAG: RimK family alpha-L-glutamate ligase [Methylotenera sp.]|nr:RimK family alpha-L-glutamate ligase [Methylotenera sp.]
MKIPIFTDDAGWHGARLKEAFAVRGVDAVFLSLQECVINLSGTSPTIQIPGFNLLPPLVFVRGVAGGTMQQVITRLNVLHMLSMLNVKIYNDVKAIERTVDKAMTSFLLNKNGISTPPTWVSESRSQVENIRQIAAQNNQTLVLKPLFGSQGLGVRKLLAKEPLPVPMQQFVDGVYYLQELIETPKIDGNVAPHDYRVFVIGGSVVAAMKRVGNTWVNNVAAGGRCEKVAENEQLSALALQAASVLEIDYCGVDIIQSASGQYYVLEVNSIPAWKGLQSVAEIDIAQLLVDDCLSKIGVITN